MMKIEIVNLTLENIQDAPEWEAYPFGCKYCIYWEFPEERIDPKKQIKEKMLEKKSKWLRNTRKVFGNCGKLIYIDGRTVGYAQYAPSEFLPKSDRYPSGPPSEDAVLISCLFIFEKGLRRQTLGGKLLHSIIDDLKDREIKVVETFARKSNANNPSGPVEFYLRNGFEIYRSDPEFPLMRLGL
jgi:GNAT superfamily N-acetyltransferase